MRILLYLLRGISLCPSKYKGGNYMREVSNPSVAKLSQMLEKEMERLGYSRFCISTTRLLSQQLSIFMKEHAMETYDICVGAKFQDDYCQHHTGKRQLTGVKLFIARINSIFNERGTKCLRPVGESEISVQKLYLGRISKMNIGK